MSEKLPSKVLHTNARGLQSDDIGYRLGQDIATIKRLLAQWQSKSDLCNRVLDMQRLHSIACNFEADRSFRKTAEARAVLLRGLGVGLFLTQFESR